MLFVICSPQQIPETPTSIQEFFDGNYRPKPEQQIIWFQLKIGVDTKEESNFFLDAKCLFDDKKKHALYRKDLQVPETEVIGYFLYSHGKQNRDRLMKTISFLLKECYKVNHPISIRWQKIISKYSADGKQKRDSGKDMESKAYHVEVAQGTGAAITKAIAHMYSSKRQNPPQKETMRYVPYPQFITNTSTKIQYNLMRNYQGWFTARTSTANSFDISDLDEVYDGLPSLRDFIMEMMFNEKSPLFTSVDFSFNGKCVIFVFPTAFKEAAHNKIADLASYAMFKHGIKFLQKYFHPEAYERAEEAPWNEEEGRAVSKLSEEFDEILEEGKQFSWLHADPNLQKAVEDVTNEEVKKPTLFNTPLPNDNASLDTFRVNTAESNKRTVTPEKDPQQSRKKKKSRVIGSDVIMNQGPADDFGDLTDDDEAMDVDDVTVDTLNSRMQNIEQSFQDMNDNIASTIQAQFAQFFQNKNANTSSGADRNSKTDQPTSMVEGTQSSAPPANAGGVDC